MFLPLIDSKGEQSDRITSEKAVELLLQSIALEEASLSQLLDVLSRRKCGETQSDTAEIGRSMDDMAQTVAQLQMLLQLKRNSIQDWLSGMDLPSCPCLPGPCKGPGCSVMGEGRGIARGCDDAYGNAPAAVYLFFLCGDQRNGTLRYQIGDSRACLHLYACDRNVTLHCPADGGRQIVISGVGRLRMRGDQESEQTGTATFTLTLEQGETGALAFRMELSARSPLCLQHDSGWVKVEDQISQLRIKWCERGKTGWKM